MIIKNILTSLFILTASSSAFAQPSIAMGSNINVDKIVRDVAEYYHVPPSDLKVAKVRGSDNYSKSTIHFVGNKMDMVFTFLTYDECKQGAKDKLQLTLPNGVTENISMSTRCLEYATGENLKMLTPINEVDNYELRMAFETGSSLKTGHLYWSYHSRYEPRKSGSTLSASDGAILSAIVSISLMLYVMYFFTKRYKRDIEGLTEAVANSERKAGVAYEGSQDLITKIKNLEWYIKQKDDEIKQLKADNEALINYPPKSTNSDLLDKANATIRSANKRVSELKATIIHLQIKLESQADYIADLEANGTPSQYTDNEWLGVPSGCRDAKLIKKNYKVLSLVFHSDRSGSDSIMKMVNAARDRLLK